MDRASKRQQALQELLREIRLERDLRQVDVAKKLGEPQSFVSKYESGERRLDFAEVQAVCDVLGIKFNDFVNRLESRNG